jgi:hypothetical protein
MMLIRQFWSFKMKRVIPLCALFLSPFAMAGFIHPMDFDGTEAQKQEVIEYIKFRVKKEYCDGTLNMCQNTTLRMMEQENLNAFKKATQATDRAVMDKVIADYCGSSSVNMCNYTTILMMYQENVNAGEQTLTW